MALTRACLWYLFALCGDNICMRDTIVELATPTGRSGIGVIRLSGLSALAVTQRLVGDDAFAPDAAVRHAGRRVERAVDAVPAKLAHDGTAERFGVLLNRGADVSEVSPRQHLGDSESQTLPRRNTSRRSVPRRRYSRFMSVISYSPRGEGRRSRAIVDASPS